MQKKNNSENEENQEVFRVKLPRGRDKKGDRGTENTWPPLAVVAPARQ